MTLKVAMIADIPDPGGLIDGGVQAVTSYLVESMSHIEDIELSILSFRLGINQIETANYSSYVHYSIPFGSLGALTAFAQDQSSLNGCLDKIQPDIVHSQGAGHHGILANRSPYPALTTIHGIHLREATYLPGFRRRLRTRIQGWMSERYCIRKARHTILISPYVADYFGDTLAGKRYLIPNPVHDRFFNLNRCEEDGRILFLGRLYALKGVKDLVRAVSRLPYARDLKVVLGGSTADEAYVNELRTLIREIGMEENFEFPGILPADRIVRELSRSSCLVLPSYQETAPMVIQEAMASGVPIIASKICGIPYQLDDQISGLLFAPGQLDELTGCLEKLLSNSDMRSRLGNAARKRAHNEFRADMVARRTVDVYKSISG